MVSGAIEKHIASLWKADMLLRTFIWSCKNFINLILKIWIQIKESITVILIISSLRLAHARTRRLHIGSSYQVNRRLLTVCVAVFLTQEFTDYHSQNHRHHGSLHQSVTRKDKIRASQYQCNISYELSNLSILSQCWNIRTTIVISTWNPRSFGSSTSSCRALQAQRTVNTHHPHRDWKEMSNSFPAVLVSPRPEFSPSN